MKKHTVLFLLTSVFIFPQLLFSEAALSQEIRIGVLPTLTGPFADLGDDCRRGVQAAVDTLAPDRKIGQRELKMFFGDSQADPKIAVNEFKKLTEQDKVLAVVATRSSVCLPLNPISLQKHVPLLCASGHPNFATENDYAYQSWPLTDVEGRSLADHVMFENVKKIAIITGEDEWLLSYTAKFKEHYQGEVISSEQILGTDYDYNSLLTKIKAKKADGLFVNLSLAQGAVVIKRARELGFKIPIYSNFWSGEESALKSGGVSMNGVTYTEAALDYPKFNEALAKLPKPKKPSGITISCFSSMVAVIKTIEKNNSISTVDEMQKGLLSLGKAEALDVSIPIENRRFFYPMAIKQIKEGAVVKIK